MIHHDEARRLLSLDLDGELDAEGAVELSGHLDDCASCAAYAERLVAVRGALRGEGSPTPDVSVGVLAAVSGSAAPGRPRSLLTEPAGPGHLAAGPTGDAAAIRPARRIPGSRGAVSWLSVAACLVVGILLGSGLVGGWRSSPPAAAAPVPERIAAAQFDITSLSARIEIIERGWNAQVPERTFSGSLDYQAPEALALHLADTTDYPSTEWVPNDVDLVRRDRQWWARGPRACASTAQPGCTAPEPRLEVIDDVAPYDDGAAVPLDLVVPVRSFLRSAEPPALGSRTIDGREAVGVEVSAAQVAPLIDGLRPAGNLRELFASDVVSLWLDAESWTPRRIEVRASDDPDRRSWAIIRGYVDQPGDEVLVVSVIDPTINAGIGVDRLVPAPEGGVRRNAGFVGLDDPASASGSGPAGPRGVTVDPTAVPDGLDPSTSGIVGAGTDHETVVQTWVGGRGWLKVVSTTGWDGTRLFGDLGSPVRRSIAADGSVTYSSLDGTRHAIHGEGIDVVVTGSLDSTALARVLAGIDVRGATVPADWDDAATESIESATDLLPGLLVPAPDAGFDPAAVRADGNVVTQAFAGAGSRGFVVVEAPGERLAPPLDMDVAGVVVRGVDGRYSAARGELEWVEGDRVHRVASSTLTRSELVRIADGMVPA